MNLRGGTQFNPTTPLLICRPLTVLHLRHPLPSLSCPSPQTHFLFLYGFISFALLEVHSTEVECAEFTRQELRGFASDLFCLA